MASKVFLRSLEKDQILKARVEEVHMGGREVLCNFQGELLLVSNQTSQIFNIGDPITLQVLGLNPLQFRIFNSKQKQFQRVV